MEKSSNEYLGIELVEEIQELIKESEDFNSNLKLPEMDRLKEVITFIKKFLCF